MSMVMRIGKPELPNWVNTNINRGAVLRKVIREGPVTRSELSDFTGLKTPTIARITADLIKLGVLAENGEQISTGGRKPGILDVNPTAGYIIGIDFGEANLTGVLTDLKATVIAKEKIILKDRNQENIRDSIIRLVAILIAGSKIAEDLIIGIGIGVPGIADHKKGILIDSSNLGIKNWALAAELEKRLGLPAFLDNNASCAALGEFFFGAGRTEKNLALLKLDNGIGLGLIISGAVFRGDFGRAGEIGHVQIDPNGPRCNCGKVGCLESFAGGWAIERNYSARIGNDRRVSAADVFKLFNEDDQVANDVVSKAVEAITVGISIINDLLSPQIIILSGSSAINNRRFVELIRERTKKHLIVAGQRTQLLFTELGDSIGAFGGVALVLDNLLAPNKE